MMTNTPNKNVPFDRIPTQGMSLPAPPAQDPMQQMLDYLFQQLRAQYPGVAESDLRLAAQKLFREVRAKQSADFNARFFPERSQQAQPAPGMVAQNEQRPWQYSPGSPGGIQYTDTPEYQAQQQMAKQKQIAEEQANFAKTQAQNEAARRKAAGGARAPGMAQPMQAPSQGTPYQPTQAPAQPLGNLTDQEIAALNAAEMAKQGNGPSFGKRYYRQPDGSVGIAQ